MPFASISGTRSVAGSPPTVRAVLVRALRDQHFEITAEQVTVLEARRGSSIGAAALQRQRLPVLATVRLSGENDHCTVQIILRDGWQSSAGRVLGLQRSYAEVFADVLAVLDAALGRHDPTLATSALPALNGTVPAPEGLLDRFNARGAGAGFGRVETWLEGRKQGGPEAWRGVAVLRLTSSEGEADVPLMRVQAMLTVALLVSRSPGSMPPALAADVERLAIRLEQALEGAGAPRLAIEDAELPVVRFLWEQARIRESVPLRTLQRCTTCRFERVVNPDFKALVERNRKIRGLGGALGASVSSHGASPFFLVGRLLPLAKLDPEYVCPRCQGLESDDRVVLFCPTCGERRDEAVLKTCPRCAHDFRKALEPKPLWHEPAPPPAVPQLMPPPPMMPLQPPPQMLPPPAQGPALLPPPSGAPVSRTPPPAAPVHSLAPPAGPAVRLPPPSGAPVPGSMPVGRPEQDREPHPEHRPAAWLPDPSGRHEARWWDGVRWTDQVLDRGVPSRDPVPGG